MGTSVWSETTRKGRGLFRRHGEARELEKCFSEKRAFYADSRQRRDDYRGVSWVATEAYPDSDGQWGDMRDAARARPAIAGPVAVGTITK